MKPRYLVNRSTVARLGLTLFLVIAALGLTAGLVLAAFTPSDGQAATLVLGQSDFTSATSACSQTGLNNPFAVAIDPTSGKVFVADVNNHRVLR